MLFYQIFNVGEKRINLVCLIIPIIFINFVFGKSSIVDDYIEKGVQFQKYSKWDSANYSFKSAIPLLLIDGNNEQLAHTYRSIGNSFIRMNQYDSAFYFIQLSTRLALDSLNNPHLVLLKGYNSLAAIYGMQGDFVKAGDYFKLAVNHHIKSEVDNPKLTAKLYNNIGTVFERISEFDSAIVYFEKSLILKKSIYGDNDKNLGSTLNNMGILYNERGFYHKAINNLKQALQTDGIEDNIQSLVSIYHNLGNAYNNLVELDLAEIYYLKELDLNNSISNGGHINNAINYISLGRISQKKGLDEQALEYFNKALDLLLKFSPEQQIHIGLAHNNLGYIYYQLSQYDQALNHFNQAKDIYESLDFNSPNLAMVLSNLGLVMQAQNKYNKAGEYFEAAYNVRMHIFGKYHPKTAKSFNEIGFNYFKSSEIEKSLDTYQEAFKCLSKSFVSESHFSFPNLINVQAIKIYLDVIQNQIEGLIKMGETMYNKNQNIQYLQAALDGCQIAIDIIYEIRNIYLFTQSKYILSESVENVYNLGVKTAYSLYQLTKNDQYKEQSFQFSELSRASLLWETLQISNTSTFGNIPDEIIEKEKNLKSKITFCLNEIKKVEEKFGPKIEYVKSDDLRNQYFNLLSSFDDLMENIKKDYPDYFEIMHPKRNIDITKIQNVLKDYEILLEYYMDSTDIYIYCISNSDFNIYKGRLPTNFKESIKEFTRAIKKVKKKNFFNNGIQLYQYLIEPIEPFLSGNSSILIVPNGDLSYLPFDSIPINYHNNKKRKYVNTNFLINNYSIAYLASADIYSENKKSDNTLHSRLIGIAPVDQFAQYHDSDFNVSALPFSQSEVQQIENLYSTNSFSAATLIGKFATESNFKSATLENYDIVHIATHGILNEEHPDLSALLFYNYDSSGDDGILYASEIYNMQFNTNLTVLSSCESGSGKMINGEGILSLSRGFMYAGTDNIIYTLWRVGDKSSNELLTNFYENVLSGMDYSQSLRQAKLSLIANEATVIPRNWSGYILMQN